MLIRRGFHGKEKYQGIHNLVIHSTWNFEQVNEVFLMEKIHCTHLVREKTHLSSLTFKLKTKSMAGEGGGYLNKLNYWINAETYTCLLYTSDAADDMQCVDLGGRRIIKKKFFFKQKTAYEM